MMQERKAWESGTTMQGISRTKCAVHIGQKGTQEVSIGYRVVEQGEEGKSEGV